MIASLVFLGVLLLIATILCIIDPATTKLVDYRTGQKEKSYILPESVRRFTHSWFVKGAGLLVSILLLLSGKMLMYAEYGVSYYLVSPFGNEWSIIDARGYKWRGFSRLTPFSKYIDIKTVDKDSTGNWIEPIDELEGIIENGIPIRFIDQVTGSTKLSIRFQTPTDPDLFMEMAKKFKTQTNLVNNTLIPTVFEQTKNTGYMYKAQDYISGAAQSFKQTLEEQLKSGSYVVQNEEIKDTIYTNPLDSASRGIREINTTYKVKRLKDKNGKFLRIPHEITENKILVSQVIVSDVDPEPEFKTRLQKQRDESAKRQLAQQQTETAKAEQMRILAQGENDKASERVKQEKDQITQIIQYETQKKIEQQKFETAELALKTAEVKARETKTLADAKAYENSKLVAAGLTPQERAKLELDKERAKWEGISKITFPTQFFNGGSGSTNGFLDALIGTQVLNNQGALGKK